MFCTKCGTKLDENAKFCTGCGTAINSQTNPKPEKDKINDFNITKNNQIHPQNQTVQGQTQYTPDTMQGQPNPNHMQQMNPPIYNTNYSQSYSNSKTSNKNTQIVVLIVLISVFILLTLATILFFVFKTNFFTKKNLFRNKLNNPETSLPDSLNEEKQEEFTENESKSTSDDSQSSRNNNYNTPDERTSDSDTFNPLYESNDNEYSDENEYDEPENDAYYGEYLLPDSDSRYITKDELFGFDAYMCRIARNELYARHGRLFDDSNIQDYFNNCSWYYGYIDSSDFDESLSFNKYELANRDLIVKYEKEMGYR